MLPLAIILKGLGHTVSGSDRSYDQGRTPEKFAWIKDQGVKLYPQDGSGVTNDLAAVVISKAVEDTIPDIRAAKDKNAVVDDVHPVVHATVQRGVEVQLRAGFGLKIRFLDQTDVEGLARWVFNPNLEYKS